MSGPNMLSNRRVCLPIKQARKEKTWRSLCAWLLLSALNHWHTSIGKEDLSTHSLCSVCPFALCVLPPSTKTSVTGPPSVSWYPCEPKVGLTIFSAWASQSNRLPTQRPQVLIKLRSLYAMDPVAIFHFFSSTNKFNPAVNNSWLETLLQRIKVRAAQRPQVLIRLKNLFSEISKSEMPTYFSYSL